MRLVKKKRRNATTDDDVDDKDCINDASPTPETNSHTHTTCQLFPLERGGIHTPHPRARAEERNTRPKARDPS